MGLRQERIADQIRDIIAMNLVSGNMRDPRLESVTITAVKVTADLQNAKVYFRVYDTSAKEDASKALGSAATFFKKKLSVGLDVRRVPELRFYYDESIENAARIETLLGEIKKTREES